MEKRKTKRKLTAILSADVKGYSRLMGEDELATVETLKKYREIISSQVKQYSGRVVDSPGDNLLAEFGSVVDAVECAAKVQKTLKDENAKLPESRRMEFRIGVNLGDVIDDEGSIYGDGVNVASRVEGLAEGGGICISRTAFDQVKNKLKLGYEYLGEHSVKNIAEPVRVYKVLMEPEAVGKVIGEKIPKPKQWRWAAIGAVAVIIIVAGALAIWNFYLRPDVEPASVDKMAFPLPGKPSIAVLPFDNLSDDPKQEYFADGLTEEIITALSKVPRLFVIARNSSFTYKGKPVKVQQVSEDLGVQYVLEGSVRKEENRVRVTAQLVDALNGRHLWAETYDRELEDIFALQDQISFEVIASLQVKLTEGEQALIVAGRTNKFEAYAKFLQGLEYCKRFNKEGNLLARKTAEKIIALDPNYPRGYRLLATTHWLDVRLGMSKAPKQSLTEAAELYRKVIAMDPSDAVAHAFLAVVYTMMGQHENGISEAEKAVAISPNAADSHSMYGFVLHFSGRDSEAIEATQKAIRLNPFPPNWYFAILGQAYCHAMLHKEAIAAYKKALHRQPENLPVRLCLAAAYSLSNDERNARAEIEEVLRLNPNYCVENAARAWPYKNRTDKDRFIGALRKAGLPEHPPLPLPDKPSIAVLPFVNMSDDHEQEYFSDGITEEIITALSKTPKLFVIARNSTFTYKGKPTKVQKVGRELGVKYVLEGSVRKAGEKVRITAQLVDATTGNHLWAERYDRDLKDIFALQDEITKEIITAMQVKLTTGDAERLYAKGTDNLEAYLKCLQARELLQGAITKEKNVLARRLAQEAIDLDPNYSEAYRELAITYAYDVYIRTTKSPRESLERAAVLTKKAIALDNSNAHAYSLLAEIYVMFRQYDKAVAAVEHAFALEPNSPQILYRYGRVLWSVGRWEEGLPYYEEAMRLNPIPPNILLRFYGAQLRELERYDEAIAVLKRAVEQEPERNMWTYLMLAVTYSLAGRENDARETAKEVLRINPKFSVKFMERIITFKDPEHTKRITTAMRKAGLPD